MLRYFIFLSGLLSTINLSAQNATSSSSGDYSNRNIQLTFSMGEPIVMHSSTEQLSLISGLLPHIISVTTENSPLLTKFRLDIYPNPTSGILMIRYSDPQTRLQYRLISLSGQEVSTGEIWNEVDKIDVSSLQKGMYLLQFINKDTFETQTCKIEKF